MASFAELVRVLPAPAAATARRYLAEWTGENLPPRPDLTAGRAGAFLAGPLTVRVSGKDRLAAQRCHVEVWSEVPSLRAAFFSAGATLAPSLPTQCTFRSLWTGPVFVTAATTGSTIGWARLSVQTAPATVELSLSPIASVRARIVSSRGELLAVLPMAGSGQVRTAAWKPPRANLASVYYQFLLNAGTPEESFVYDDDPATTVRAFPASKRPVPDKAGSEVNFSFRMDRAHPFWAQGMVREITDNLRAWRSVPGRVTR